LISPLSPLAKLIRLRQASTNPLLLLQPIIDNLDDGNTDKFLNNEKILIAQPCRYLILAFVSYSPNFHNEISKYLYSGTGI
jgi:hypothetical protein